MWTEDWGTLLLQTLETPCSFKALPASSSGKLLKTWLIAARILDIAVLEEFVQSISYTFSPAETCPLAD